MPMRTSVTSTTASLIARQIQDWAARHSTEVSEEDQALALILSGAAYERGATVDEAVHAATTPFRQRQSTTSQPRAS